MAHNPDCINCTICGVVLGGAEDWKADVVALAGPHWPDLSPSPPFLEVASIEVVRYAAKANSNRGSLLLLPENRKVCPQFAYDVNQESNNRSDCAGTMYGDHWDGWWDEDPIIIPDLSILMVENLEPAGDAASRLQNKLKRFRRRIESLPQEVKDLICLFLSQAHLPVKCNYIMPQSMWMQVFFLVPFLWDLDTQLVLDRTASGDSDSQQWDWEKITRQVMSPAEVSPSGALEDDEGIWSFDKVGLSVPGGFANRRRIWQIVEEMYPNDVHL
ncbi:hypothetical protein FGADI_1979 [Fusarium gaditjirri]|uniref:Uncharacterized protein n=1 Tax=Fusarium gaditjirri TaxID=282569 RepID=A0A8H4X311_9HYPO|nr:hypothetical protein FGADI_1979 [Fusarium gaditjirri]